MILSLQREELIAYYTTQLNNFFPDLPGVQKSDISSLIDVSLDRLHFCFKHVTFARYNKGDETIYNHLYSDHNLVFNWFLSNTAFVQLENKALAAKFYYLNKVMHSFDCMYDTALPDIFLVFHGSGTMLGKATYNDYFVCLQGCTVGSHKSKYPVIGKGVALTANSSIIGDCNIGNRVSVSTRTTIFSKDIADNHAAYMDWDTGALQIKPSTVCYAQQFFTTDLMSV